MPLRDLVQSICPDQLEDVLSRYKSCWCNSILKVSAHYTRNAGCGSDICKELCRGNKIGIAKAKGRFVLRRRMRDRNLVEVVRVWGC